MNTFFIVAQPTFNQYALIGLNDGNRWNEPSKNVDQIFAGDKDKFELVTEPFTITPGE